MVMSHSTGNFLKGLMHHLEYEHVLFASLVLRSGNGVIIERTTIWLKHQGVAAFKSRYQKSTFSFIENDKSIILHASM